MDGTFGLTVNSGGATTFSAAVGAGVGTALASYLKLVEFQNRAVVRSQFWNGAIPMCEAGIEEALRFYYEYYDVFESSRVEADCYMPVGDSVVVPNVVHPARQGRY